MAGFSYEDASARPGQGFGYDEAAPPPKSERLADIGRSLKSGIQQLPGQITGLADVIPALAFNARPFTKAADIAGDITGFTPGKWAKETKYSPAYEQSQRDIGAAWEPSEAVLADPNASKADYARSLLESAPGIAKQYIQNPTYTAAQVANSIPSMVAGGVLGRGMMVAGRAAGGGAGYLERAVGEKMAAPIAAGVGEGAQQTGQQMDQYQGADQRKNAIAAVASGGIDALIGAGSGRVANALGLETAGTALAKAGDGKLVSGVKGVKRVAAGALNEGLLQEVPQSAQEQAWQNWVEGKPLGEGVARQAIEGGIAGGVMGAGANVVGGRQPAPEVPPVTPPATTPGDAIRATAPPVTGPLTGGLAALAETQAQAVDAALPTGQAQELTGAAAARVQRGIDIGRFNEQNAQPLEDIARYSADPGVDARELSLEEAAALAARPTDQPERIPVGRARELPVDTVEPADAGGPDLLRSNEARREPRTPKPQITRDMTDADVVRAYVEQRRAEGTLAGRRFAGDFDAGRISAADVLALVKPRAEATPDERLAAAAAQAEPQKAGPNDLVTADGFPYGTRAGARSPMRAGGMRADPCKN